MRAEFGVAKEQAWVITAFRPGDDPPREITGALGWKIALPSSDPSLYNPAKFEIVYFVTLAEPTPRKILRSLRSLRITKCEGLKVSTHTLKMMGGECLRLAVTVLSPLQDISVLKQSQGRRRCVSSYKRVQ